MMNRRALPALVAVLSVACGTAEPRAPSPALSTQLAPLDAAFERAGYEYQVPAGLLKAIAYVETRVAHDSAPSLTGGYGVMQLSSREDWNLLRRAAELTGVPEAKLKLDPEANVR